MPALKIRFIVPDPPGTITEESRCGGVAFQTGRTVARLFNHFTDSTEMVGELAGGGSSEGAEGAEEQHDHIVPDQASALLVLLLLLLLALLLA
jgi:hypothetical protein